MSHSVDEEIAGVIALELINVFGSSLNWHTPSNLANTTSMPLSCIITCSLNYSLILDQQ